MAWIVHSELFLSPPVLCDERNADVRHVLEWNVVAYRAALASALGYVLIDLFPRKAVQERRLQWNIVLRCVVVRDDWTFRVTCNPRVLGLPTFGFWLPESLALAGPQTRSEIRKQIRDTYVTEEHFCTGRRVPSAAALDALRTVCARMQDMQHLTRWKMLLMVTQGQRARRLFRRPSLPPELWWLVYELIAARNDWWPTRSPR